MKRKPRKKKNTGLRRRLLATITEGTTLCPFIVCPPVKCLFLAWIWIKFLRANFPQKVSQPEPNQTSDRNMLSAPFLIQTCRRAVLRTIDSVGIFSCESCRVSASFVMKARIRSSSADLRLSVPHYSLIVILTSMQTIQFSR